MQFNLDALDRWTDDHVVSVSEEDLRAYAEATNDPVAAARAGASAPPVFAMVPAWTPLQQAAHTVAPEKARPFVVHGEQDIVIHHPIAPGTELRTRAAPIGVHVKESGTTVILKTETRDADEQLLNEQYVTEFYRGISGGEGRGATPPERPRPGEDEPETELTYKVAEDQTRRYAEASGDHNAFHLDDEVARAAGLPGIIVHGLCLMAFAGRAVLESQGVDDPAAVRRFAVRFSRPMAPGDTLTTRVRGVDSSVATFAFDCLDGSGAIVLKDGLLQLAGA